MVNLRLQKRLASSILKCGRRKVWIDPNEMNEIDGSKTRTSVRKLIRDGFIIKKPQKVHSRFHARRRAIEKKKGRHLGKGSRKGTRNARCPTKMLWMLRQRAVRRLLQRYRLYGKIDRRMYHRFYLRAKGGAFKNKANLIEHIDQELQEKKRQKALLEQYNARRQEALQRRQAREAEKKKRLEDRLKIAEEAQKAIVQEAQRQKREAELAQRPKAKGKQTKGGKGKQAQSKQQSGKGKSPGKQGGGAKGGAKGGKQQDKSGQGKGGGNRRRRR